MEGCFCCLSTVEATMDEDGLLGYMRPSNQQPIKVSLKSEVFVWCQAWMGPRGMDYCALVEALPGASVGLLGGQKW